jgi:AcrR family transcriptional regulator
MSSIASESELTGMSPARRPGRPRLLDEASELQGILDAALAVMRRNEYQDVTVADILAEAGMSTRSFYRHFDSKDQLLCALYRRDAERAADRLRTMVDAAANPRAALEVWVDEILSFGFQPSRASRVAILGSANALRAEGSVAEAVIASELLVGPLVQILEQGAADGSFPLANPADDAAMVQAMAWASAGLSRQHRRHSTLAGARRAVLSFCFRALGVAGESGDDEAAVE